jgi:hypothetical protein
MGDVPDKAGLCLHKRRRKVLGLTPGLLANSAYFTTRYDLSSSTEYRFRAWTPVARRFVSPRLLVYTLLEQQPMAR